MPLLPARTAKSATLSTTSTFEHLPVSN